MTMGFTGADLANLVNEVCALRDLALGRVSPQLGWDTGWPTPVISQKHTNFGMTGFVCSILYTSLLPS